MKRMRLMGLCLIAVFAAAAVAAAAASAAPEFAVCSPQVGGQFSSGNCNAAAKPGKGKDELTPIVKKHFTSKITKGIATLETVGGTKITCESESGTGEFKSNTEVGKVVSTFTGCSTSGLKCKSPTATKEGEIITSPLGGGLGVEKTGSKPPYNNKLAEELHSESGNVAEFSCAGLPVVVKGALLHPVTTNKPLEKAAEKFKATKGKQKPEKFVGGPVITLESNTNGGPFERAGQTIEATATYEEKIEANSIGK